MRSGVLGVASATAAAAVFTLLLTGTVATATANSQGQGDAFITFWYGALIVSFGAFLPLEQVVSRAVSRNSAGAVRVGTVVRLGLLLFGVATVGVLGASPLFGSDTGTRTWVAAALIALALVSALQYAARGVTLGRGRMRAYACALLADSGLRALGAVFTALIFTCPPGAAFAACVVGSALVAHAGLVMALRRPDRSGTGEGSPVRGRDVYEFGEFGVTELGDTSGPGTQAGSDQLTARAVLALLAGSLAAQVLLNAGPLLVGLGREEQGSVAAYGYAFTLARVPLFAVVPIQAILVPLLARMVAEGRQHELRMRMAQVAVVVLVIAGVGAAAGAQLAGPAMAVFTQGGYQVSPGLMAVLVSGCLVHAGLVIGTQALVASGRERWVLACWVTGLVIGAVVFAALRVAAPHLSGGWTVGSAFAAGSLAGWGMSVVVLMRRRQVPPAPVARP